MEDHRMNKELLECLKDACKVISKGYYERTGKQIEFEVLQLSDISKPESKRDVIRELAKLYDEYKGNEDYIHIPDAYQLAYNARHYPIIIAIDKLTNELEGVTSVKYRDNQKDGVDPYYPKENRKFYSITGIIVRQRQDMQKKGLGTSMYEAATLGLHNYVVKYPEEDIDITVEIDCTNIKSLYAKANANSSINVRDLIGEDKRIISYVDGIYVVTNQNKEIVEAPTFVINEKIIDKKEYDKEKDNALEGIIINKAESVLEYTMNENKTKEELYKDVIFEIMKTIKMSNTEELKPSTCKDEDIDKDVTYIQFPNTRELSKMTIKPNGIEKLGADRKPTNDTDKIQGPMPNIHVKDDGEER